MNEGITEMYHTMKDAHAAIKASGATLISANGLAAMLETDKNSAASLLNSLEVNGYLVKVNAYDYSLSKWFNDDSRLK